MIIVIGIALLLTGVLYLVFGKEEIVDLVDLYEEETGFMHPSKFIRHERFKFSDIKTGFSGKYREEDWDLWRLWIKERNGTVSER